MNLWTILKGLLLQDETRKKEISIEPAGTDGTRTTLTSSQTTSKTLTLPDANDTLLAEAHTQTVTNKNMKSNTNLVTGAKADNLERETGNEQVLTIPDTTGADTLVSEAHTQTMTNKTIGDDLLIQGVTESSNKDTGALVVEGGAGIEKNLNVGGSATITGDLTVNGTTTTVNTTNLDVTDANITINNGGTQAAADLADAGLTVEMSDATNAVIGYDSALTSKFKIGEVGSESEIATRTHSQILENKTIDGTAATGNNTITTDASNVTLDPAPSTLTATTSQAGFNEVAGRLDAVETTANNAANKTLSNLTGPTAINQDLIRGAIGFNWNIETADTTSTLPTGNLTLKAGDVTGAGNPTSTGAIILRSGEVANGANVTTTGSAQLSSGSANSPSTANSGPAQLNSGSVWAGNSGDTTINTGSSNSGVSGDVNINTGTSSNGANSGNIILNTGLAPSGVEGNIILTAPKVDLTGSTELDVTGVTITGFTGGANTTLSNLTSPTSVNQHLIPDLDDSKDLGTSAKAWRTLYLDNGIDINGTNGDISIRDGSSLLVSNYRLSQTSGASSTSGSGISFNDVTGIITSSSNGSADANQTGNILIETGNKSAGTGNSGDINLETGASAGGTRGSVNIDALDVKSESQLTMKEIATPATPAAGYKSIYPKADGKMYTLNDAGEEVEIGSGSGSGGINYITNPDFETNANDWIVYEDFESGDPAIPTDGIGGTPAVTLSIDSTVATVLRGTQSLQFNMPNFSVQSEGFSTEIAIDNQDLGKKINISFDYSNTNTSGLRAYIYDMDNTTLLGSVMNDDDGYLLNVSTSRARFMGSFFATDSTNYRVIVHMTTTDAVNDAPRFDNVKVGPEEFAPGVAVIDQMECEGTLTNSFSATSFAYNNLIYPTVIKNNLGTYDNTTGTYTVQTSGFYKINAGFTVSLSSSLADGAVMIIGLRVNGSDTKNLASQYGGNNNSQYDLSGSVTLELSAGDTVNIYQRKSGTQTITAAGDARANYFSVEAISKGNLISTTETLFSTVNAFGKCAAAQSIPNNADTVIDYDLITKDEHGIVSGSGSSWKATAPTAGDYEVSATITLTSATGWETGEIFRGSINRYNSSDVLQETVYSQIVEFPSSDGSAQGTYAGIQVNATMAANAGDYFQIGMYQTNDSAITLVGAAYNYFSVKKLPNFSVFGVHGEYEAISALSSNFVLSSEAAYASGEYAQMVGNSIDLPVGIFKLWGVGYNTEGTGTWSSLYHRFGGANGDNTATLPAEITSLSGVTLLHGTLNGTVTQTTDDEYINISPIIIQLTEPQTIYLNTRVTFSVKGNSTIANNIIAERLV